MRALLIIDMQKVSFTPKTPRFEADKIVARINILSEKFREMGLPVVFIQHNGVRENYCLPGSKEWEILDEIVRKPGDVVIAKEVNDGFYQTQLHHYLQMNNINELVVTGCATDFCVDATVKSALTHDYNLTIIADAHTTADRPHVSAQTLIAHHNWLWSELTPTEGKIKVVEMEEYLPTV